MTENTILLDTIGKRLKYFRKEIIGVVRQFSFAEFLKINVNKYIATEGERAKIPVEILPALVNVFYIDLIWLFTGEGEPQDFGKKRKPRIEDINSNIKVIATDLNKNVADNMKYDKEKMRKARIDGYSRPELLFAT